MKGTMETVKKIGQLFFSKDLKGPLTDSEMQKVVDFYLKNNKTPGPDKFQENLLERYHRNKYKCFRNGSTKS